MSALTGTSLAIAVMALIWVAVAVALAIAAARRFRLAEAVLDAARTNAALLETTPARPMVVHPDHKIEADGQLLRQLGLKKKAQRLADLVGNDSGIHPEDLDSLTT